MKIPDFPDDDPAGISTYAAAKSVQDVIPILAAQYRLLFAADQVVELRALKVKRGSGKPHTEAGFFGPDSLLEMARLALDVSRFAKGVYYTMNPIRPELRARRATRLEWAEEGDLTKDKDVLSRRWLLIDVDSVRDPHISASDEEKAIARDTALAVREHLRVKQWPDPILADSGNGFHLLYRVDLPAADGGCIERILKSLAAKFDTPQVHIDTCVHNPGRICKLPGTLARKGDNLPPRAHRRAKLLEVPGHA